MGDQSRDTGDLDRDRDMGYQDHTGTVIWKY